METSMTRSGIGKTPLSRCLAMAISEFVINRDETEGAVPSYRCGNHLDFFRGTPGFVAQPCIYDDGDTPSDKPSWLKIFLDPSEDEASFWARWGACRFEKHQARLACSNVYDNSEEPEQESISGEFDPSTFIKMIRPLFNPVATAEDINAILKRTFFVLFGKNRMYFRSPSPDPDAKVRSFGYWPVGHDKDLLSESGVHKLSAYRAGDKNPPPSDQLDRAWQLIFMNKVVHGEPLVFRFYTQTLYDEEDKVVGRKFIEDKPTFEEHTRKRSHAQMIEDQDHSTLVGYIPGQAASSGMNPPQGDGQPVNHNMDIDDVNLEDELNDILAQGPNWDDFLLDLRDEGDKM